MSTDLLKYFVKERRGEDKPDYNPEIFLIRAVSYVPEYNADPNADMGVDIRGGYFALLVEHWDGELSEVAADRMRVMEASNFESIAMWREAHGKSWKSKR